MGVSKKIFEDSEFGTNIVSVTNDGKTYMKWLSRVKTVQ